MDQRKDVFLAPLDTLVGFEPVTWQRLEHLLTQPELLEGSFMAHVTDCTLEFIASIGRSLVVATCVVFVECIPCAGVRTIELA